VANEEADELDLAVGQAATTVFKACSVMVAVARSSSPETK
jgi:molybdopterin-binding protein